MASSPSLAEQMVATAQVLQAVQAGRSLTVALARAPEALRPGVQALAFHALRHLGAARAALAALVDRTPPAPARDLLLLALTLLWSEAAQAARTGPSYAAHTVVDQAVGAARAQASTRRLSGLVNACLRRFLRERDAIEALALTQTEGRWNHPAWWVQRVQQDHPQHASAILDSAQHAAPMVLRVNRRQRSRQDYLQAMRDAGLQATPIGQDGVRLDHPVPVQALPGFGQGWVSVQDAAAQLAAPLLLGGTDLPAGARVLDACAAPGGKTAHLLESADLDLLALDVDAPRCQRIEDNLRRLHLHAEVRCADAAQPQGWFDGRPFDAILLDAPCTASGIVRRHPDVPWLRRPTDVAQLAALQRRLLDALWPLLKPGGRMLYATCSVFRAEGQDQVQAFLKRHADARESPTPGHLLPASGPGAQGLDDNLEGEHDGFFYARLDKAG